MALSQGYKDFSPEFFEKHHHLILYDEWHRIQSFLLFPPNCSCKDVCLCGQFREKIVLSLNVNLYNKLQPKKEDLSLFYAMKLLLKIPGKDFFMEHYAESYPLWLLHEEFKRRETPFKIVDRLIWTLLRLAKTHKSTLLGMPKTSINKAVEIILGGTPLKTKERKQYKDDFLCGEKAYGKYFNKYKSVCHFIAAFQFIQGEKRKENEPLCTDHIEKFLSVAHWFRKNLLDLVTTNVKNESLFSDAILMPLPVWVHSDAIDIPINPFEDQLHKFNAEIERSIEQQLKDRAAKFQKALL